MPFTPLHMGPGMVIKAAMPRHFSIVVFGLTQVAIDLEVLQHIARHEYPYHTFCHTYPGASIMAVVLTVVGKPASQWIKALWNRIAAKYHAVDLSVSTPTSWTAAFTGSSIGAYSHILFDSLYHLDIEPLQPWSAVNPFRGIVTPPEVDIACVFLGSIGVLWFFVGEQSRRKADNVPEDIDVTASNPEV